MKGYRQHKKLTKAELATLEHRKQVYQNKLEEYDKLSLEELKALFNNKEKRIGGVYKLALVEITNKKLKEEAIKNASDSNLEVENAELKDKD